ncbi:MAG: PD-(D/E)XK nuclease family protein [Eggerthellaceae bacterium]|nr:PD-(D/E)XK nuclease family protein [Eggerthellaceae bacterium]
MKRKVILFSTYEQALSYRKGLAQTNPYGLFGISVETPYTWLVDAWERFGDGRTLLSSLERTFATKEILSSYSQQLGSLPITDGTISLLSRFFAEVLGATELEDALANPEAYDLSEVEHLILSLVPPYRELLRSKDYIEPSDALTQLSEMDLPFEFSFGAIDELSLPFQRFFSKVAPSITAQLEIPVQITKTVDHVRPILLLAEGPSAQNALIARAIQADLEEICSKKKQLCCSGSHDALGAEAGSDKANSVIVVSSDAHNLFSYITNTFTHNHSYVTPTFELHAQKPFVETDFGRAFNALRVFLLDDTHEITALLDYVDSPFSGIDSIQAAQIVSAVHGDRLLSYDEAHAMIHLTSPHFDMFEELFLDSDASLVLDYFYDIAAEIPGKDAFYRSEQGSAISALRSVYELARKWNLKPGEFEFAIEGISIDSSCVIPSPEENVSPKVAVVSPEKSKDFFGQSFDYVYLCDLDSRYYSADERHDALTTLETKLGISNCSSELQSKRMWFEHVKALTNNTFYCERVLSSGEDEDIYASFLWDEFIECYRDPDEDDDSFGKLPSFWASNVMSEGELSYDWNANSFLKHKETLALEPHASGVVSKDMSQNLFLSRIGSYPQEKLILSPSAIEAYVNCPYSWFVSQRIRPESPDEELGPLEQGTFVHSVFDHFYKTLPAVLGQVRVTKENLKQAQAYLSEVFEEQLAQQPNVQSIRYVPLTPMEKAEAQKLKQTLLNNLSVQSRLLPEFSPTYSEFVISPKDECEYAGVVIRGRVDRIDVNAELGQYVVLDYKGGIIGHDAGYDPDEEVKSSKDHDDFAATENSHEVNEGSQGIIPHKIQALIYAQVLRRLLPERPVGALYLSYRAQESRNSLAGSYDDAFLDVSGFARRASAVKCNFDQYLSLIENMVARCLEDLKAGNIEQKPLVKESCKYCPVATCPRRLS